MTTAAGSAADIAHAESLLAARELTAALTAFDCAEANGADADRCSAGRWLAHMLRGDFEAAWRESDAIRRRGAPDPHRFWLGEDFTGKRVMLRCLHGFGDAVQFLRYAPLLRKRAAHLTVEVPPALLELAPCFAGVDDVITWGEQAPRNPPGWDVQIEINELPYVFRTSAAELPVATQYLHLRESLVRETRPVPRQDSSLRIGLVWASGSWNPTRSVPFDLLRPLLSHHHCEFWNLQGGSAREDWQKLGAHHNLHDADRCAASVPHLAALIAQLDVVITPDTLAAHLAGALGVRCWLMLEHAADWRWEQGRNDSPWYPSLRLFRQPHVGDWAGVVSDIERTLHALVTAHPGQRLIA